MLIMSTMAMSLIISYCSLAIFLVSYPSLAFTTRTLLGPRRVAAQEELNNNGRNESRRKLGYFNNNYYNSIDGCWMSPYWENDRKKLADCVVGFGKGTIGGKEGDYYEVTTTEDHPTKPWPGTLRYGVIQDRPLWITFRDKKMVFRLQQELIMNSHKTIDGRGSEVHVAGPACFVVQRVENIIIHGIHVYNCEPTGGDGTEVISSEHHTGFRGRTDGDAVSLWSAQYVWVDHNYLSNSNDGLIDAVEGSTYITISNNRLTNHNEAMLFGHSDYYTDDKGLRITLTYNHFGPGLTQRVPRGRFGVVHLINNLYEPWLMYAVGGSAEFTIFSQGNRYIAPDNFTLKEVTKRLDKKDCNWITHDDDMINGAFFVKSGSDNPDSQVYDTASTMSVKDPKDIYSLVSNAGPLHL